jgi:hypothetical protein
MESNDMPVRISGVTCARVFWRPVVVFLVAFLPLSITTAGEFYRWTDAQGRLHLSDRPPPNDNAADVQPLTAPRFVDPGIPPGYYSVTEQWQRLQAEGLARQREQRERARQARELALREREVAASERAAEGIAADNRVVSPVWIVPPRPYPHVRPYYPTVRPVPDRGPSKPIHPAYRPLSRPLVEPYPAGGSAIGVGK